MEKTHYNPSMTKPEDSDIVTVDLCATELKFKTA